MAGRLLIRRHPPTITPITLTLGAWVWGCGGGPASIMGVDSMAGGSTTGRSQGHAMACRLMALTQCGTSPLGLYGWPLWAPGANHNQ